MRVLADENISRSLVEALEHLDHDVLWIRRDLAGLADQEILRLAQSDARVVLTADRDFGELAFGARLPASCGIVLLRLAPLAPDTVVSRAIEAMALLGDWTGRMTVIEPDRVRSRPLPSTMSDKGSAEQSGQTD